MTPLQTAHWFHAERGIATTPIPYMKKGSVMENWNERILEPPEFAQYFNGEHQNISVLTGPKNLTDVDIDSREAWWAWKEYELATGMKWGHGEVTPTHFLYWADEAPRSAKYLDPVASGEDACLIELRCRDKGGKCLSTLAPPSMHPLHEPIEFVGGAGHPGKAAKGELERRARLTAAASMLGRHARDGVCHQIFIALAGAFARQNAQHPEEWELGEAQRFLRAVYRVKWRETADLAQAGKDADSTYQHYDDGGDTTGLRTLSTLLEEKVFRQLKQWLGLETQEAHLHSQPAPQRKVFYPEFETFDSLREQNIVQSTALIEHFLVTPGLTLMVGASRSGKTVLAIQMAMSLANHLPLFEEYTTGQAGGLLIEWDDRRGKASIKDFTKKCRASREGQPLRFHSRENLTREDIELSIDLTHEDFLPWLKGRISEYQAKFLVLDSYTALRGFHTSRDIVKLEATELSLLNQLACELNIAMLLIHHTSKTAAHQERHARAAGSFAMQAVSEAQIVVERFSELPENDPARLVSVRGRHQSGIQMVLTFRQDSLDFDWVFDGPAAEEFPRLRQLLRSFRGISFTAADVTKEIGWAKTQVYALMTRLMGSGIVNKHDKGWSWNESFRHTLERI